MMGGMKDNSFAAQSNIYELIDVSPGDTAEKLGTEWDQHGMVRMGKKQELPPIQHYRLCHDLVLGNS